MPDNTIEVLSDPTLDQPVTARWEACEAFSSDDSGSPVCAACGWLDGEHGTDAVVHQLPGRFVLARRLAS
ncbi:MAG: hypothetical protein ACLPVY_25035 [Acidimicrobiia bacterium]